MQDPLRLDFSRKHWTIFLSSTGYFTPNNSGSSARSTELWLNKPLAASITASNQPQTWWVQWMYLLGQSILKARCGCVVKNQWTDLLPDHWWALYHRFILPGLVAALFLWVYQSILSNSQSSTIVSHALFHGLQMLCNFSQCQKEWTVEI